MSLDPRAVYCTRLPSASYTVCMRSPIPELPGTRAMPALDAVRRLLEHAGLDADRQGTPYWNPLQSVIRPGHRVVIKPNWVHHINSSGLGLDCLVTHTSVVQAVLHYALKAGPADIVIGDAPIQGCDFAALWAACQFDALVQQCAGTGVKVSIADFRRTILPGGRLGHRALRELQPVDKYVLFDLRNDSDLEAITRADSQFRVTMYDPDALMRTHGPGKHQYLIAREVIEADVVISLPKLKTHKRAGLTGALKNMVGINGNKEYLPHHRKGGSLCGGDCYEGKSLMKRFAEDLIDAANRTHHLPLQFALARAAKLGLLLGAVAGHDQNWHGSWHGNDTVWRMCLDLQRILFYGRPDGTLAVEPQRKVLTITDAIVAGEGDGPLAPAPVPLGMMTLGMNPPALEWVHALLMGLDPNCIRLTREAFSPHRFPLAQFGPDQIAVFLEGREILPADLVRQCGRPFRPPKWWRGHCELPAATG